MQSEGQSNELKIGIIGGTGLGEAFAREGAVQRHEIDTPFGRPSDAIIETQWAGQSVLLLARHGPGHVLNPSQVPYRANIFALTQLGCTHLIASGAVGSLRSEFKPRHLVIADQFIDKTFRRPSSFFERSAVHVEFAEPMCPVLRQILISAGSDAGAAAGTPDSGQATTVHDRGCYVCMEGPAFSTRAESLMHRLWGGDLIGMTALPEAKLSREAEIPYALVALVTDYDCWQASPPAAGAAEAGDRQKLLEEILGNLQSASSSAMALIRRAIERMEAQKAELMASPARSALRLAIWSDKSRIDRSEIDRLAPLWGRYFVEHDSGTGQTTHDPVPAEQTHEPSQHP